MRKSASLFLLGLSVLAWPSLGQTPPPPAGAEGPVSAPQPRTLADLEREIASRRDELAKRAPTMLAELEKAEKNGTLAENSAAAIRGSVNSFNDPQSLWPDLSSTYLPFQILRDTDGGVFRKAWGEFRAAVLKVDELQQRRAEAAQDEIIALLKKKAQTADDPAELNEVDAWLDAKGDLLEPGEERRPQRGFGGGARAALRELSKRLRNCLDAKKAEDYAQLGALLVNGGQPIFTDDRSALRTAKLEGLVEKFRRRMLEPLTTAVQQQQLALEQAIMQRKPFAELTALLSKLTQSGKNYQDVRRSGTFYGNDKLESVGESLQSYTAAIKAMQALSKGDFSSSGRVYLNESSSGFATEEFPGFLDKLRGELETAYNTYQAKQAQAREAQQRAENEKQQAEARAKRLAEKRATRENGSTQLNEVKSLLGKVQSLTNLYQVLEEVAELEADARLQPRMDSWQATQLANLGNPLQRIATAWESGEPAQATQMAIQYSFASTTPASLRAELNRIAQLAQRDCLAAALEMPALKESPWRELPPLKALQQLAQTRAEQGDWVTALRLLEAQTQDLASVGAIQSYLAGQKLEQAEQFPEAILAYQMTLQYNAKLAPVKEASERLKELKLSQPAAFDKLANRNLTIPTRYYAAPFVR